MYDGSNPFSIENWKKAELNPKEANEDSLNWIFVIDTLNFSFWEENPSDLTHILYNGKEYSGYWGLCAAINRAVQEGIPLTEILFNPTEEKLRHIFRHSKGKETPMIKERLQEAGQVLLEKFDGKFSNLVLSANKSALKLVDIVTSNIPSYMDHAQFQGKQVFFFKRAQILAADIWACFANQSYGEFHDINEITMFADYRVPQILAYFDILKYSEELQKELEKGRLLPSGDPLEAEIRGNSIWAVELLRREMEHQISSQARSKTSQCLNAITIDFYLWDLAQTLKEKMSHIHVHRTRSVFY